MTEQEIAEAKSTSERLLEAFDKIIAYADWENSLLIAARDLMLSGYAIPEPLSAMILSGPSKQWKQG